MSSPYVGEIRIFAGNFAPAGWAFCDGQLMPISENDTLFTLIGTTYGGDGQETFGIPNLQGRLPIHMGTSSASGTTYQIGEMSGVEDVTLTVNQIPAHTHPMLGSSGTATSVTPITQMFASALQDVYVEDLTNVSLHAQGVSPVGGSQPHTNLQPYLCMNFIISLFGIFPTQT
jgi:microcystin-dependent protein